MQTRTIFGLLFLGSIPLSMGLVTPATGYHAVGSSCTFDQVGDGGCATDLTSDVACALNIESGNIESGGQSWQVSGARCKPGLHCGCNSAHGQEECICVSLNILILTYKLVLLTCIRELTEYEVGDLRVPTQEAVRNGISSYAGFDLLVSLAFSQKFNSESVRSTLSLACSSSVVRAHLRHAPPGSGCSYWRP
jgi:hypothetical protein